MKNNPINILQVLTENKNRFVSKNNLVLDYDISWQKKQSNDKLIDTEIIKLRSLGHNIVFSNKLGYKLVDVEIKKLF